ncbi:unnamed protein product [Schistosoma bovis]|nr:unnamed protein product [Schistosoma bovis]
MRDETFSLTGLLLPLLLQSGSTSLFSLKLIKDDNPHIHISPGSLEAFDAVTSSVSDGESTSEGEQLFEYMKTIGPTKKKIIKEAFSLHSEIKLAIQPSGPDSEVTIEKLTEICEIIDWNLLFESVFNEIKYDSYKNMKIVVYNQDSLKRVCDKHTEFMRTEKGRKNLHSMTVISFLFNMRNILNRYFKEFYPANVQMSAKKPTSCIDEVKENFRWTIEKYQKYSSISESTQNQVLEMFKQLKTTFINSLSSKSWSSEDEKQKFINLANEYQLSIITSKSLSAAERDSRDFIFNNEISEDDYLMNVYYSQKTKFLKSIYKPLDTDVEPDAFSFMPYISSSVEDKLIKVSAGLLNLLYHKKGYSMSEQYGTIGWFIGRQLMYEVNNNKKADAPESSQFACNSPDATVFEAQLCCLQKQDEFKEYNEKNLRSLSADINGLMLSFKTYTGHGDLQGKNSFYTSFAKMMCNSDFTDVIHTKLQSPDAVHKFRCTFLISKN